MYGNAETGTRKGLILFALLVFTKRADHIFTEDAVPDWDVSSVLHTGAQSFCMDLDHYSSLTTLWLWRNFGLFCITECEYANSPIFLGK